MKTSWINTFSLIILILNASSITSLLKISTSQVDSLLMIDAMTGQGFKASTLLANKPSITFTNVVTQDITGAQIDFNKSSFTASLQNGTYKVNFSMNGYIPTTHTITIDKNTKLTDYFNKIFVVSPIMKSTDGLLRAVLTWCDKPKDLDLYMTDEAGNKVYYKNKSAGEMNLDIDDRDQYGPETITLSSAAKGKYRVYVKNYSKDAPFDSCVKVSIYQGNRLLKTYNAPNNNNSADAIWDVAAFDSDINRVADINTVQNILSPMPSFVVPAPVPAAEKIIYVPVPVPAPSQTKYVPAPAPAPLPSGYCERPLTPKGTLEIWGTMTNNQIYYKFGNNNWRDIPGSLVQISVNDNGRIWGVNAKNQIYTKQGVDGAWQYITGSLSNVAVTNTGKVWGVNSQGEIYTRDGVEGNWRQVPGSLKNISANSSNRVWGVNALDDIYTRDGENGNWQKIEGKLSQISVADDGRVWGVNSNMEIWTRCGVSGTWEKKEGGLKNVTAKSNGRVYGTSIDHGIYVREGLNDPWYRIDGGLMWTS